MRKPSFLFFLLFFLFPMACTSPNGENDAVEEEKAIDSSSVTDIRVSELRLDCEPDARVLEGNRLIIRELGLGVFIGADSTTYDPDYGESHRLLMAIDLTDCSEADRHVLPVNETPDIAYTMADVNYHRVRQVIAIKGRKTIMAYDVKNKKILGPTEPSFLKERQYADAQSGNIERLEVWEDYLVGYATDLGAFVFRLTETPALVPKMPLVEIEGNGLAYRSLFLIPLANEKYQAIIPSMADQPPYGFSIETVFEEPLAFEVASDPELRGNVAKIGRTESGEEVVVDLGSAELELR